MWLQITLKLNNWHQRLSNTHITHQHIDDLRLLKRLRFALWRLAFEDKAKSVLVGHIEKCQSRNG